MYKKKNCKKCNIIYIPKSGKSWYCSKDCAYKEGRKRLLADKIINSQKHIERNIKYGKTREQKILLDGGRILKYEDCKCIICNKIFIPNSGMHKYCSRVCGLKAMRMRDFKNCHDMNMRDIKNERWRKWYKNTSARYSEERKNNLNANIKAKLGIRIRLALLSAGHKKSNKTMNILGCTLNELKIHLEKQFKEGMNWSNCNRHGWHLDHIIPCAAFDLTKEEEQNECFHYSNLQPLWEKENLSKGKKIIINGEIICNY